MSSTPSYPISTTATTAGFAEKSQHPRISQPDSVYDNVPNTRIVKMAMQWLPVHKSNRLTMIAHGEAEEYLTLLYSVAVQLI